MLSLDRVQCFLVIQAVSILQKYEAKDENEALIIANDCDFGLSGSVWTKDIDRGLYFAQNMETGLSFVNEISRSDARLPFGGIKNSGYGRELSSDGILEFVNIKSIQVK